MDLPIKVRVFTNYFYFILSFEIMSRQRGLKCINYTFKNLDINILT